MTALALDLFSDRRYDDLVQIGLSRLPGITPAWTDYNAHDPGITLMELLAAISEAQLYSFSRMRRDERTAYAAIMGIAPSGTSPATGLIWPDPSDPDAPAANYREAMVIETDAGARINGSDTPLFHPEARILRIPAAIRLLQTRLADGTVTDQLSANKRGGPAYTPLGDGDGSGAVLRIGLVATGWAPLLPADRRKDALLAIGFRADAARTVGSAPIVQQHAEIEASLITDDGVFALPIRSDGTDGMARSGVVLLDVSGVQGAPAAAMLEFRAPRGVDRPPRVSRIDVNVIPVVQCRVVDESHDGNGLPDQQFDLETPGIAYAQGGVPLTITVQSATDTANWTFVERLADSGPADRAFSFDPVAARVTFGNGLNGAIPPAETTILAHYTVTEGSSGNLAANRKWTMQGFEGTFGVNVERFTGGADAPGSIDQRRTARTALRDEHPLVSAADFKAAALALSELEVARAWVVPAGDTPPVPGVMQLLVMRARGAGGEPAVSPETPRWLEAVRRTLAPQALLGGRLEVIAPRYVDFTIAMTVQSGPGLDPTRVRDKVLDTLVKRLTPVSTRPAVLARDFGQPLSVRDLTSWIKALAEVRSVSGVSIRSDSGATTDTLRLPPIGLPHIDLANSAINVVRADAQGAS
jgi:predicted phage baseplate assembly protein